MDNFNWVDQAEAKRKEDRSKEYFDIAEGDNKFVLLSHCAPLAQVWTGSKYRPAEEGDKDVSIKGVCWVYQDGVVKSAKLPYSAVKAIRALQLNDDWEFALPFPHVLTLNAKNAGTTEVKYTLIASPKKITIPEEILTEMGKKPSPEDMVEKLRGKVSPRNIPSTEAHSADVSYPTEEDEGIDTSSVPF